MHPLKPSRPRPAAGRIVLLAAALLLVAVAAGAAVQSLPMVPAPAPSPVDALRAAEQPPMRIAERFGVEPVAAMSAARVGAVDQLQALASWNRSGALPVRIGFLRPLPLAQTVRFDRALAESPAGVRAGGAYARAADGTVWGTAVRVEDAYRLRLRLTDVRLPEGARLWVYAEDGETVGPFGRELVHEGELLTPSVAGPVVNLEVEVSPESVADGGDYGFRIAGVAEMVRLGESGEAADRAGAVAEPYLRHRRVVRGQRDLPGDRRCAEGDRPPRVPRRWRVLRRLHRRPAQHGTGRRRGPGARSAAPDGEPLLLRPGQGRQPGGVLGLLDPELRRHPARPRQPAEEPGGDPPGDRPRQRLHPGRPGDPERPRAPRLDRPRERGGSGDDHPPPVPSGGPRQPGRSPDLRPLRDPRSERHEVPDMHGAAGAGHRRHHQVPPSPAARRRDLRRQLGRAVDQRLRAGGRPALRRLPRRGRVRPVQQRHRRRLPDDLGSHRAVPGRRRSRRRRPTPG